MPNSLFQSLGNHEFDNGVNGLTPFIEKLNCPVLAANLILTKVPELDTQKNLKKSVILEISGRKIGIIGYLTPDTKFITIKNDVDFSDEIVALQKEVANLQNEGVNIIIALGHSGYLKDQQIANEVEGVNIVIGGHSHSFLWNGTSPEPEEIEGPYPTYVRQASGKIVPVVQAYAYTKYLGKLHLLFDADNELIISSGAPILLDNTVPEDPEVARMLKMYKENVDNVANEVIGSTTIDLEGQHCNKEECNLGNLITDAMVDHYAAQYDGEHWTDAPIALLQAGSIRASIARTRLPADLSVGDLMAVMPFKGPLATITLNGSTLIQALEHSVAKYLDPRAREFLQLSGLKVVYDYNKPVGSRVNRALARCWACSVPEYFKVENKEVYKVILPYVIAQGGDGFSMLADQPGHPLPYNELNSTIYYVQKYSPVRPELEGRIIIHQRHVHKGSAISSPSLHFLLLGLVILI